MAEVVRLNLALCAMVPLWVGCWTFRSWHHLRSFQDRYWLVMVHTHGDLIVLTHWEIRPSASWPDIPLSADTEPTGPCNIIVVFSARLGIDKYQSYKSLVWLDQERTFDLPRAMPTLYRFSYRARLVPLFAHTHPSLPAMTLLLWLGTFPVHVYVRSIAGIV